MAGKVHWRRLTTQIAMMSVVIHAIMAALMLPVPPAMAGAAAEEAPGSIVICTGTGYSLITFDENGNTVEKQLPSKLCPICNGIATSAFLLETAQTALIGRLINPTILRPSEELRPASLACLTHNNRGPPSLT